MVEFFGVASGRIFVIAATGLPFTAGRVQGVRHHWNSDCHQPGSPADQHSDQLFTIADAAEELRLPPSTLHRWITEGFIDAEQITTGAPGRIRLTDHVRALFVDEAPHGWLAMLEATHAHGLPSPATLMGPPRLVLGCRDRCNT